MAQVIPPEPSSPAKSAAGSMAERTGQIGNIMDPLPEQDWEVLR